MATTEPPWTAPPASPTPYLSPYIISALVVITLYALYRQLLPKPLPDIAYNAASAASLLGDAPDMTRTVGATGEFGRWCAAQIERAGQPLCQVFIRPRLPWVLLADYREAHDLLARRTAPSTTTTSGGGGGDTAADFDKSSLLTGSLSCLGTFHAALRAAPPPGLFGGGAVAAAAAATDLFRRRRALVHDLMAPPFLHGVMGPAVHGKALELVRLFGAKMRLAGGRPFRAEEDLDCVALDVVLSFAFGDNLGQTGMGPQAELVSGLTSGDVPEGNVDEPAIFPRAAVGAFLNAVRVVPSIVEGYIGSVAPRLQLWWWKKQSWYKEVFSVKDQVFREQTAKALKNYRGGEVRSALEHMLRRQEREAEKQGQAPKLEEDALADELFGEILAGSHTTGGMLGWLAKNLTAYPDAQARLRDALHAALPQATADGRAPSYEELRRARLPYLDAFIEETLRLNAVPVTREATRDTTVLGRHIPRGTQVFLVSNGPGFVSPAPAGWSPSLAGRSPTARAAKLNDRWDDGARDPGAFDPERWLSVRSCGDAPASGTTGEEEAEFNGAAGPQLVFGHGVRGCWGKRLAMMEMRVVVALLVWHFELLEIPEALAGNAAIEGVARRPKSAFVRLREAVHHG